MPLALYAVFAALSVAGAYLAVAHWRGRTAGIWAAVGTVLFFGALLLGLWALMQSSGVL